ncbi:MAG: KTSC domain-containing protein [Verrucomicrobiia bacterium]|jgi:hypothetical protein
MVTLNSSDLRGAEYDPSSATLTIVSHDGSVYEYYGVPHSEYIGLLNATSHGQYFHAHIKDRYRYRKVS